MLERKIIQTVLIVFFPFFTVAQNRDYNYYLEQAKQNSPLINQYTNNKSSILLDLKQVKSVLSKPEINIDGNILFAPIVSHDNGKDRIKFISDGASNYSGYDLALTDGGQYQAGISIKQPLLTGSILKAYSNNADVSTKINDNNIALTVHELEQLVGYQYILCLKAKMQANNNRELLMQINDQLIVMQKLVEKAIYKQTDLMLMQIEQSNLEADYNTSQAEYRNNLLDLNLICGINDTSFVDIQAVNFTINPDITSESNFLTSYKLDSLNLLSQQSIFEQKYKPTLSFFANAGLNAVYIPDFNRLGCSMGLTFSWNIFDGHQKQIQRQKTSIGFNTLAFERSNFITQHTLQKSKIVNQINTLEQRIQMGKKQAVQYDILLNTYLSELSYGQISVMDLKNLLKEIAAKKNELAQFEMERQTLINSYNYWNY